jgi:SsrA-binding protein
MAKKKPQAAGTISNKRARHDYAIDDTLVVGVVLNGRETKALRMGHGQLRGSYVTVKDNELWLLNAQVNGTNGIPIADTEGIRTRKLLAKRKEIDKLIQAKQQGNQLVPLEILTKGRYIKVRVGIGKGKKEYDKRETLKKRDQERNVHAQLKSIR